jgi:hypothetical protein
MRFKFFNDARRLKDWLKTHEIETVIIDIEMVSKDDDGGHGYLVKYVWV